MEWEHFLEIAMEVVIFGRKFYAGAYKNERAVRVRIPLGTEPVN
jgi:hypothetical protein